MTEHDLIKLIQNDSWMMDVLNEAEKLNLPDWMIGAGFLRNKVWDHLHGIHNVESDTSDIDLVYFDSNNVNEDGDKRLSQHMKGVLGLEWEIINQAYTHKWHDQKEPYVDATHALSEWVETATCVAVRIENGNIRIITPHGLGDLMSLIVRPVPAYRDNMEVFHDRYKSKRWLEKWPKLKIIEDQQN